MEELFAMKDFYALYDDNQLLVMVLIMIIAFFPMLFVVKRIVSPSVKKVAKIKGEKYEKTIEKHHLTSRIFHLFASLYLVFWGDMFDKISSIPHAVLRIKEVTITVYLVFSISTLLLALINIAAEMYKAKAASKRVPIGLHTQILKIFITICAILTTISLVMGISISSVFTSLGAAAALLTFVFKDALLGLTASLQLTFQDIIKVGDWVSMPSYNADGTIEKITITVVVIRNFDQTYTTVPTYAFLTTGVKNWRAMFESGGRRIKRSINMDMAAIEICKQKDLDRIKTIPLMSAMAEQDPELFKEKSAVANITLFRKYIDSYLKSNDGIHKEGFTFLVRQLNPTPDGLPIELYIFTKDTNWVNHENIQSDIFDHLIGIMPQFKLKAFQSTVQLNADSINTIQY